MKRLRFRWWHLHVSLLTLIIVAIVVFAGGYGATHYRTIFGQKLDSHGQAAYKQAALHGEFGTEKAKTGETLPPAVIAKLRAANQKAALAGTAGPDHPVTLATPEPITRTSLVQNYSSRNGYRPALFVVHDTESPNVPGLQDVAAIAAWFNNPQSQASSNYTTDAEGDTFLLVPETAKAWTQAYFNPWAISDELIGYATQTTWPDVQLRAVAQIAAAATARWGIPVQRAVISGCTIVRPGITEHLFLGACGGGHHDAGPHFPLDRFVALVKEYRAGGYHPLTPAQIKARAAAKRHAAVVAKRAVLRKRIVALRAMGESWQLIETKPVYRQFRNLGGR